MPQSRIGKDKEGGFLSGPNHSSFPTSVFSVLSVVKKLASPDWRSNAQT
jgi:hypothetical protein